MQEIEREKEAGGFLAWELLAVYSLDDLVQRPSGNGRDWLPLQRGKQRCCKRPPDSSWKHVYITADWIRMLSSVLSKARHQIVYMIHSFCFTSLIVGVSYPRASPYFPASIHSSASSFTTFGRRALTASSLLPLPSR